VDDAHQLHPWVVLGAMASHAATLPHRHLGGCFPVPAPIETVAVEVAGIEGLMGGRGAWRCSGSYLHATWNENE